jgi:anti-sigma-K factor RskA
MLLALGELSSEEAASIEQRVAADPALQRELQSIRENLVAADAAFDSLNDVTPAMVERASSRAAESVWQWQLQQTGRRSASVAGTSAPSRWMLPAAAAAVALLIAGSFLLKNWKHANSSELASQPAENSLPSVDHEEQTYDDRALNRLAFGVESWDDYDHPGTDTSPSILPPPVTPPVASNDENPEAIGGTPIASGEPFFNVPLSADPEPTP